ncbi:MAG: DUF1553 domain-containing protein, partial [Gemmataceae bacterium]|nr:DUF1553 domain-containing protein [Gemmataceae bacterium]
QKKMVATNPSLAITPGVLYQYDQKKADELKKEQDAIARKRAERPAERFVEVLDDREALPVTRIHHRGDWKQPTREVKPGDLTVAAPEGKRLEIGTGHRRLAWARHLTSGTHPLAGRVLANRLWQHVFGRGLVSTPGDFGVLGQRPTHHELLDWLAAEMARDWDMKRVLRLLLTSRAFKQSSRRTKAQDNVDAGNALLGRFSLRRLEAEAVRDAMLMAAGRLDRRMGGAPVPVTEDISGQVHAPDDKPRRTLYLQARRTKPVAFLTTFDAPSGDPCDARPGSVGAPQALALMNGDFVLAQARRFADRLKALPPAERVAAAWRIAYQRLPSSEEASLAATFLARQARLGEAALVNLCQQLLSSSEFLHAD